MRHALIAVALVMVLVAPSRGADDVEAVHKLLDTIEQAWSAHDLKALGNCCADNMLVIVSRPDDPQGAFVAGKVQALEQTGKLWANVVSHQFVEREIIFQDGVAWMRLSVADKSGDRDNRLTRVINAAIMEDGVWKMCFSMPQLFQPTVVVADVLSGTPADRAGVRPGDTLISVNGRKPAAVGSRRPADSQSSGSVRLVVRRGVQDMDISIEQWPSGATLVNHLVPAEPAVLVDKDKPHGVKARILEEFAGFITNDLDRAQKVWCQAGLLAIVPPDPQNKSARLLDARAFRTLSDEQMQKSRQDFDLAVSSLVNLRVICVDDVAAVTGRFQSVRRDGAKTAVSSPIGVRVYVRQGTEWYWAAVLPWLSEFGAFVPPGGVGVDPKVVQERISGQMVGIGVGLEKAAGGMKITQVMAGSPAERGGLGVGEVIVTVDGQSLAVLSIEQAVEKIKGEEGSKVALAVLDVSGKSRSVELTRGSFRISPVTGRIVHEGIGLVSIPLFSEPTPNEFRQQVRALQAKGARALILDLRTCTGGTPQAARDVAEALLPEGKLLWIVQIKERNLQRVNTTKPSDIELPLVVLIGRNTGGAPELLASALKENGRAVLMGQNTSGAARLKSVVTRPDGTSELVEIGALLAKPGAPITDKGVAADVKLPADASEKAVLNVAVKTLGEAKATSR